MYNLAHIPKMPLFNCLGAKSVQKNSFSFSLNIFVKCVWAFLLNDIPAAAAGEADLCHLHAQSIWNYPVYEIRIYETIGDQQMPDVFLQRVQEYKRFVTDLDTGAKNWVFFCL